MDPESAALHAQKIAASRADALHERDARLGIGWWNDLTERERAYWMAKARSAVPAEAWEAFKRSQNQPDGESK